MSETEFGVQPGAAGVENLDLSHASFKGVNAAVENVGLRGIDTKLRAQLQIAFQAFPKEYRPSLDGKVPKLQTSVISNPESATSELGFVSLAGAGGSGPGVAHIGAEFYKAAQEHNFPRVGLTIAVGSPASVDTRDTSFSSDPVERAAYQAAVVIEELKKHPTKELILTGHSMGGMDMAYILPLLKSLIAQNELDTKIKGIVFIQAVGQYEQSIPGISARSGEVGSLRGEMKELYPSVVDISEAEDKLQRLEEGADMGKVLQMRRQIEEMRKKKETPQHLTEDELSALTEIDTNLEQAWYTNDRNRINHLISQRGEFFLKGKPSIMQRITFAADTRPKPILSGAEWVNVGRNIMGFEGVPVLNRFLPESGINTALPDWVRNQVDVPVATIWGEKDAYVPSEEAQQKRVGETIDRIQAIKKETPGLDAETVWREGQYFPDAPVVFDAVVANVPHIVVATDTPKYAKIVTDIVERMYSQVGKNQESNSGQAQKTVHLSY